jgi:thiamine monophosphate kinase
MKIIKEQILNEMAMEGDVAVDRCYSLGLKFIQHFNKIYEYTDSLTVHHWCSEMQAWWATINRIVLRSNNKQLSYQQRLDWFYLIGSSFELCFDNDKNKIQKYRILIDKIEVEHKTVYKAIVETFDIEG